MRKPFARSQFRWSIATILTLSMVLIIALVMALTTLLDVRRERAIFRNQLEEKGLHLFSMLESAAAEPDFPNQHELNDITAMMMSQPDLSYFRILTPDGLVLASSGGGKRTPSNQATPQALQGAGPILSFNGDAFEVSGLIEKDSTTIAAVEFGFDAASLASKTRGIAIDHLVRAFIFIAIGIPISYLIAQHFVRPIRQLVIATKKVSEGELDFQLRLNDHRSDEIGDLGLAFSDMTTALRESRDQLEGMVKDERRKSAQFEALKDIAELGLVDGSTDEMFQSLLERIIQAHQADGGSIYILNPDNNTLEPLALKGVGENVLRPRLLRPDNGVVSKVMAEARSLVIEDFPNSPLGVNQRLKDLGVRTVVASPLIVGGRGIGAMSLHYKSAVTVETSQLAMIELMAEGVAHVIERARLLELERQQAAELARMNEANVKMMQELELAQKRDIQSAKMAAMGQLAGGVAHEINNPLASILGFAQLAKLKLPSDQQQPMMSQQLSTLERYLGYIDTEAKRCGRIVSKLQTFTRTPERDMASVDINELLEQAGRITTNQTALSTTRVETQLGNDLPLIKGHSASLVQVFTNIITNATRAMPEEGGMLAVTSRLAKTESASGLPMVEVVFEDTGLGISEENVSKVFEPFFTTAEPGQGTGLGLYVCYQIVRQHDGEIDVYSQAGEGTTVVVKLPVSEEEQEQTGLQSLPS